MSGHIPLRPSNYTPYTSISSKISAIGADCLCLSGVLASGNQGLVSSSEPTDSSCKITMKQGCSVAGLLRWPPVPVGGAPPAEGVSPGNRPLHDFEYCFTM